MTPADGWDGGAKLTRHGEMLASATPASGRRAVLLLVASVCRDLWPLLVDQVSRAAVVATEDYFTGRLDRRSWVRAVSAGRLALDPGRITPSSTASDYAGWVVAMLGRYAQPDLHTTPAVLLLEAAEAVRRTPQVPVACRYLRPLDGAGEVLCGRLRCLLANPFRPAPAFGPAWRTRTVVALATATLTDRDFARLPMLADALEDAGCDDADLLAHARGPGPHVFGCRVISACFGERPV